jgi:hypothetical protein
MSLLLTKLLYKLDQELLLRIFHKTLNYEEFHKNLRKDMFLMITVDIYRWFSAVNVIKLFLCYQGKNVY